MRQGLQAWIAHRFWRFPIIFVVTSVSLWGTPQKGGGAEETAAQQALRDGDYERAEQLFRSLLETHPESSELLHNLGIALHLQARSFEAAKIFEQALAKKETPETLALLGLSYCRMRRYDEAQKVLARATRYFADSTVLAVLGPCYLETGDPLDAVRLYKELVQREASPRDENAVNLARAYFRSVAYFRDLLQKAPGNEAYLHAVKEAAKDPVSDVRAAIPRALKQDPDLRADMSVQELAQLLSGRREDAAFLYLAVVACGEEAIETFLSARKQYPNSPYLRRLKAEMLTSQGREVQAIAEYEAILQQSPDLPGLHHDVAVLYRNAGDLVKAIQHFQQELLVAPYEERAIKGISDCLTRLGRDQEVRDYLVRLAAGEAPSEWVLLEVSKLERRQGNTANSIRYLELAADLYPKSPSVHYLLSQLHRETGRPDLFEREIAIFRKLQEERAARNSFSLIEEQEGASTTSDKNSSTKAAQE